MLKLVTKFISFVIILGILLSLSSCYLSMLDVREIYGYSTPALALWGASMGVFGTIVLFIALLMMMRSSKRL
jgi:hypothetical protein